MELGDEEDSQHMELLAAFCITGSTGWRGNEKTEEFEQWLDGHQHKCHANFEGSSDATNKSGVKNGLGYAVVTNLCQNYLWEIALNIL